MNKPTSPPSDREMIGGNKLLTTDYLDANFAKLVQATEQYEKLADQAPEVLEDDEDNDTLNGLIKKGTAAWDAIDDIRVQVKAPFLDAERVAQAWFVMLLARIAVKKTALEDKSRAYMKKKRDAEQRRRDDEARIAREKAEADAVAAAEAKRVADEAAAAARQAENDKAAQERAKVAAEEATRTAAVATSAQHSMALAETQQSAPIDTVSRGVSGTASLAAKWVHTIENMSLIDLKLLAPYMKAEHIDYAIRQYIKANKHLVDGTKTKLKDPDGKGGIPGVVIYDEGRGLHR